MESSPFPDLHGSFEVAEVAEGQLDDDGAVQAAIAEQQLRNTHWRLSFKRVQYGSLHGETVCLIVVEGKFHAEESKRHRFTWVRISAEFKGEQSSVEVLKLAPERAHGLHVPEERVSQWAIRLFDTYSKCTEQMTDLKMGSSNISVSLPGIPATIDLFSAQLGHSKKYPIDLIASMQGSTRGFPKAKEAVWTLEEAKQEGVPWRIPSMIVVLKCSPGEKFVATFNVQTKVNASINPLSWSLLKGSTKPAPVPFDGKAELVPPTEELDKDFSRLDISKLTKLDFADDK